MKEYRIPNERLPDGFVESLESPPDPPVTPVPAATVVLLRDGPLGSAPEVLLLRRHRSAGFVPGAYVFPGGRVDTEDREQRIVARTAGLTAEEAAARLELPAGEPPALAYYLAAVREAFEETGLLIARDRQERFAPCAAGNPEVARLRQELLRAERSFAHILERLDLRVAADALEYIAHWITPEAEPRRYDTRFFAAVVPRDREVTPHRPELVDALWCPPADALEQHRRGALPMIFPTLRTLESLTPFARPEDALAAFRRERIRAIQPKIVRGETGVSLFIPD
ncbi:MAG: NUDIX hydrolase [Gemmatimonadetes bacterium]|nr:NUDIX hydrolase [Gemmatimonadota bacterium]